MNGNLLEIVACSLEDCRTAEHSGAGRIELCSAIELGGLTPSVGMYQEIRRWCKKPIVIMIRSRPGNFTYSWKELTCMRVDVEVFAKMGAAGIVFGAVTDQGTIHTEACNYVLEAAGDMEKIFHRAFDQLKNPMESISQLADMGYDRILTSGGQPRAIDAHVKIRDYINEAQNRIEILPAGKIRSDNVRDVLEFTGAGQVHAGPFVPFREPLLNGYADPLPGAHQILDGMEIAEMMQEMTRASFDPVRNRKVRLQDPTERWA